MWDRQAPEKVRCLHILGALDRPSAGDVYCAQLRLSSLSENAAADFRNTEIGFVWQFHYLLPEFTALENVAMPLLMRGTQKAEAEKDALHWLQEVGLAQRSHHRAGELSGGEQQRVALARALITKPKILLADEPTGDLDNRTGEMVFELISRLHREYQLSSVVATHNLGLHVGAIAFCGSRVGKWRKWRRSRCGIKVMGLKRRSKNVRC